MQISLLRSVTNVTFVCLIVVVFKSSSLYRCSRYVKTRWGLEGGGSVVICFQFFALAFSVTNVGYCCCLVVDLKCDFEYKNMAVVVELSLNSINLQPCINKLTPIK